MTMTNAHENNPPLARSGRPEGPPVPLGAGVSLSLLLISIIWMALWIALIFVARHAESFQKFHAAHQIIWIVGLLMISAGAYGAYLATDELAHKKTAALRNIALWLWITAATIALGRIATPRRWPWVEILIATIITAIAPIAIKFARKKKIPDLQPPTGAPHA
jgi:hypothetical protein